MPGRRRRLPHGDVVTTKMSGSASAPSASALETVAFALIGAAVELPRCLPRFVDEQVAKQRVKIDQQITLARFLGKMAVSHAQSEIKRRMSAPSPMAPAAPMSDRPEPVDRPEPAMASPVGPGDEATTASQLPIEHYDELSASQVLQRLVHLDSAQLAMIHHYESTHRRRRTVLGRVEQLQARGVVG